MKTDTSLIDIHTLRLSNMSVPTEISTYCGSKGIKKMVYTFLWKGRVMKYGKSGLSLAKKQYPGDRVYRQAANIPGWTQYVNHQLISVTLPRSSSGAEMQDICNDITTDTGCIVHKDDVLLIIEDMTHYPVSIAAQPNRDVDIYEAEKIQEYISAHKVKPIGNLREEKSNALRTIVSDKRLFSVMADLENTI